MEKNENPEEFDPTENDGFLQNLEEVFKAAEFENEAIDIDTESETSILTIREEAPEELPVIDTSDIYGDEVPEEKEVDDEVIENISNQLASQVGAEYSVQQELKKRKEKPVWALPAGIAAGVFLLGILLFAVSKPGRNFLISHGIGKIFGNQTTYAPEESRALRNGLLCFFPSFDEKMPEDGGEEDAPAQEEPTPAATAAPAEPQEEAIFHFLVLGMDEQEENGEASSDLMLVVTVNAENGEIKLTTILRDLFVSLPGIGEEKICMAHTRGGISLVYDTLELNLGIRPDGYFLFSYDKFRDFIDRLGGVDIALTAKEADYLNKTNYISRPENRVLVNGENHLNGDQALGYCRIRHVGTAQNEYNDIGRTARCQRLIMALYEQNRSRSAAELYSILTDCFSMLTTDITGEECSSYLNKFLNMPEITFSSYRIPAEGSYTTGIIRGRAALVADLAENSALWQEFLFPPDTQEENADGTAD